MWTFVIVRTCSKLPAAWGSNCSSSKIDGQFLCLCRFLTNGISLCLGEVEIMEKLQRSIWGSLRAGHRANWLAVNETSICSAVFVFSSYFRSQENLKMPGWKPHWPPAQKLNGTPGIKARSLSWCLFFGLFLYFFQKPKRLFKKTLPMKLVHCACRSNQSCCINVHLHRICF